MAKMQEMSIALQRAQIDIKLGPRTKDKPVDLTDFGLPSLDEKS